MKYFRRENLSKVLIISSLLLMLPVIVYADYGDVGFFTGIWQGVTFPFRVFLKLIWTDMTIYEQFNSTYGYHVGFLLGIIIFSGGGSRVV